MKVDLEQLEFIDHRLRDMALHMEAQFGVEFTVTSIYRIGDAGVHGQLPVRGLDFRCTDAYFGRLVQSYINTHWTYDPDRDHLQCCIYHDVGQGAHLHLQVHPNTVRSVASG